MDPDTLARLKAWLDMQALGAQQNINQFVSGAKKAAHGAHELSLEARKFAAPHVQDFVGGLGARAEGRRIDNFRAQPMLRPENNVSSFPSNRANERTPTSDALAASEAPFRVQIAGEAAKGNYRDILQSLGINPDTLAGYPKSEVTKPAVPYGNPSPDIPYPQYVGASPGMGLTSFPVDQNQIMESLGAPVPAIDDGWIKVAPGKFVRKNGASMNVPETFR